MSAFLTVQQLDAVLSLLSGGADLDTVVSHRGFSPGEFDAWLRKPRQKAARAKIRRAMAQADLDDLGIIGSAANTRADAASGTWQAAKTRLELRRQGESERELRRINALAGC